MLVLMCRAGDNRFALDSEVVAEVVPELLERRRDVPLTGRRLSGSRPRRGLVRRRTWAGAGDGDKSD